MTRIAGLVQARMGSTRLSGKVMRDLAGTPLVGHIIERLRAVTGLCGIVLATTADPRNDGLADYARRRGAEVYRAKREDDIAERLVGAAHLAGAEAILKINGDCPLVDPAVLARLVSAFEAAGDADYVSNKIDWTFPMGLSAEVIRTKAMEWCDANLTAAEDRELIANWIKEHPDRFKQVSVTSGRDLGHLNWSVDTPEDFAFVEKIFYALHPADPLFGLDAVLAFLATEEAARKSPAAKGVAQR